jgi:membrane protein DedA with SNARE-associated domain
MAGLRLWKVLGFAAISAALWNAALLSLGYAVGYQIEPLAAWVDRYTRVVWLIFALALAGWLILQIWRRARSK